MPRPFSGFPTGLPGVGLLVLRLLLGGRLIAEGSARVFSVVEPGASPILESAAATSWILGGGFVIAGFVTPLLFTFLTLMWIGLVGARIWAALPMITIAEFWSSGIYDAAIAISLGLMGPGAYSIDARRHGRQEVVIPPRQRRVTGDRSDSLAPPRS